MWTLSYVIFLAITQNNDIMDGYDFIDKVQENYCVLGSHDI